MMDLHDIWHRRFTLNILEYLIFVQKGLLVLNNILLESIYNLVSTSFGNSHLEDQEEDGQIALICKV